MVGFDICEIEELVFEFFVGSGSIDFDIVFFGFVFDNYLI